VGKRSRPVVRVIGGVTVIELDDETVDRNPLGLSRYRVTVKVSVTLTPDVTLSGDGDVTLRLTCVGCGIVFEGKRATARFCSDKCRQAAHREKGG
jgi:hypothetical protein